MFLAGCLIAAVGVKRLLQRRRRRPGETIAMPAEPARLEHVLEASSEPGSVELLDRALRTLAHHAAQADVTVPDVRGARIASRTLELLLDDPATTAAPLAPFAAAGQGRWSLDEAHPLLTPAEAREIPAPYPGLVTLGTDPDGSHLLLNLATTRVLLLDGDENAVRDTARVIALEAATSAWSDHAEVLTIGLGTELPALLHQGRLRAVPHLCAAQSELGELLLEHHQHTDDADADEPAPLPWLLICSAHATTSDARHLADTLTAARNLPVALVLPAHDARATFPDAAVLSVGSTSPQRLDALDSDVVLQSLTEDDYNAFLDVLHTAEKPAHPAEGAWTLTAPAPLHEPIAAEPQPVTPFTGLAAVPEAPFAALAATSEACAPDPTHGATPDAAPRGPPPCR
ncbi:hypothetical protein [Streptomyces huasconensis]|uniref:hypothetical protein n=1 Tax=Streptomyces huasconensis TaxID=1854574 RepID=UPI0036FA3964